MEETSDECRLAIGQHDSAPRRLSSTPRGTASYIAELTVELAKLARDSKLDVLAYLLDIAQLEASTAARRLTISQPPR